MNSYKLKKPLACGCGRTHTQTCGEVVVSLDNRCAGIYWDCECGLSLYATPAMIFPAADEMEAA